MQILPHSRLKISKGCSRPQDTEFVTLAPKDLKRTVLKFF